MTTTSLPRISLVAVRVGDYLIRRDGAGAPDEREKVLRKKSAGRVSFMLDERGFVAGAQLFEEGYTLVERDGRIIGELNVR